MADLDDLQVRLAGAKLAGRKVSYPLGDTRESYAYEFRSNEQAAELAVDVVGRWLADSADDPHREELAERCAFFEQSQKNYYQRIKRMTAAINAVLANEGEFLSAEAQHDLEDALSPTEAAEKGQSTDE